MELILNKANLKKSPERRVVEEDFIPGGILNSSYQKVVKQNFKDVRSNSIFAIRSNVRSRTTAHATSIETIIKVIFFLIVLGLLF